MRHLAVLSAVYPTQDDRAKGRPVWATLEHFPRLLDFTVYCSLPWRPAWFRRLLPPRSYLRYPSPVDASLSWFRAISLVFPSFPGWGRRWNGWWLSRALIARTREHRPDAILAFRAYPEGYAAVLCGRRLRLPVIISVRGSDLKMAPSVGPVRAKTQFALRQASAVLAVSQDLGNIALALGASADRVHVVRNGIDRQVFRPLGKTASRTTLQFPLDARIVLFVGNLLPVKGVCRLVDALAILHRRGAGGLHLVLIGDGNLEPQLRRQATKAELTGIVHFLGQRSPEEVAHWMSAADLLCLPSESEGLPNVILEALSCGCPVVGTTVGGIPELVVPGCGLLVPPGDTAALAQAIQEGLDTSWDSSAITRQPIDSWARVAATTLEHCERAVAEYQAALGDKVRTPWRRGVYSR